MPLRILQTNDFHGHMDAPRRERLRGLRADVDLYFDCGDAIRTGNLGVPMRPDPIWADLASLDCTASVPGNRESHVLAAVFRAKLAGAEHPILCANMRSRTGELVLPDRLFLAVNGLRIAVTGVMVPMVTPRMATQAASQFLWDSPSAAVQRVLPELRDQADTVILLSHVGLRFDREIATAIPGIDIILGGHSHSVLETPERVGDTWIGQAGSHGRFAGVYEWDGSALTGGLVALAGQGLPR